MAGQDSNDRIAELLKEACAPAAASPGFKAKLRQHLIEQSATTGAASSKPFWQRPLVWIPAAAAAAVATVLIIYFAAFHSSGLMVITSEATGIETTTATLNGNLDNLPETKDVQVSFEWGNDTSYGQETSPKVFSDGGNIQADLSGLKPSTTYHYRLKVVDEAGTRYGPDRTFTTGPELPVVSTAGATKVKTGSATLGGNLDSLGSSDRVGVSLQWGLTKAYGHQSHVETMRSTGGFTAEVSELRPGTTYHFRAKADGDGDPVYGADMTFTTGTSPPSVETKAAVGTGAGSVRLVGRLTSTGTAGSVAVSFVWGDTPGGPYSASAGDQVMTSEGNFTADLTGLQPGATYYCRARADGDQAPVYGEEKSFLAPTQPPSVTTGHAVDVHAGSATLHGVLASLGTAETVEVCFEWGPTADYGTQTARESRTSPGEFNATLSGLLPNTTYHFRARASGDGDPVYGTDMIFTTGSGAPEQSTWYLSQEASDNGSIMYQGDESQPEGTLTLYSSGQPASLVWRADQAAVAETRYPAGDWSFSLLLSRLDMTETVKVEIGTSDNAGIFVPYGFQTLAGLSDSSTFYAYEDNVTVTSFAVPSGGFVAIRVTTSAVHRVYLQVGGSRSFVQSPAYQMPTAPMVTTSAPSDVGQTTVTLQGYLDSLGTAGSALVYFEWGTTEAYGNRFDVGYREANGDFSAAVAALSPNTVYHFRAVAEGNGTAYGADLVFATLP